MICDDIKQDQSKHTKTRNKVQTRDKWQIQSEANTNKNIGIYTHPTYTHKQTKTVLKKQRKKAKK